MKNLSSSHPAVFDYLSGGEFAVQLQESHPFSQIACDLVIEVTINRDTKTKGGLIGFSQKPAAVQRWILSHHERAAIARKCLEMAGESTADSLKTDLKDSRKKHDEKMTRTLIDAVFSLQNPFSYRVQEMINISTGTVASDNIDKDMSSAYSSGKLAYDHFVCERLVLGKTDFFAVIKSSGLNTFKQKAEKTAHSSEQANAKEDKQLLTRIMLLEKHREIDLKETVSYSLVSPPLVM